MIAASELSLGQLLIRLASTDGDLIRYRRGSRVMESATGAQILERAQRAATAFRSRGIEPGDRVLLMLTTQSEFIDAFFGAVWADGVPVPLFPPMFSRRPEDFAANFAMIAKSAGAKLLVVSDEITDAAQDFVDRLGCKLQLLPRSSWNNEDELFEAVPTRRAEDIALVQYTSGSTGSPKGVALSHANLLANMQAIGEAVGLGKHDVGVTWLPLYHDMGLVGVLATLFRGGELVILSTLDFVKDPVSWLRAIGEHGGTLSPAPNFAYERCLRLTNEKTAGLDLSTWRVAFNGAEIVKPDTMHEFTRRFGPLGFRKSAFYPVYGLAEHTLAVSFPPQRTGAKVDTVDRGTLARKAIAISVMEDHADAVSFVSVGTPLQGVLVEVRDEQGAALPDGHVGEIVVRSSSVMKGYFNDPVATDEVILDGWLHTGDLGYRKHEEIYLTGRIKDVIIRAGRNYYPEDLESAANGVNGLRAGRVAAFSVPNGRGDEHVVLLAETNVSGKTEQTELIRRLSAAVATRVGFRPDQVELRPRHSLPITSSGKIRRRVVRELFLAGVV